MKFIQIKMFVLSVRLLLIRSYSKYCPPDRMSSMTLNNLMTTVLFITNHNGVSNEFIKRPSVDLSDRFCLNHLTWNLDLG